MDRKLKGLLVLMLVIPFSLHTSDKSNAKAPTAETEKKEETSTLAQEEYILITSLTKVVFDGKEQAAFQEKFAELMSAKPSNNVDQKLAEKNLNEFKETTLSTILKRIEQPENKAAFEAALKEEVTTLSETIKTFLDFASTEIDLSKANEKSLSVIKALGEQKTDDKKSPLTDFYAEIKEQSDGYEQSMNKEEEEREANRFNLRDRVQEYGLSFLPEPMRNLLELMNQINFTDYMKLLDKIGMKHMTGPDGEFKITSWLGLIKDSAKSVFAIMAGKDYIKNPAREGNPDAPEFTDNPELKDLRVTLESISSLSHIIDHLEKTKSFRKIPLLDFYETQIKAFVRDPANQEKYLHSITILRTAVMPPENTPTIPEEQKTDGQKLTEKIAGKIRKINPWVLRVVKVIICVREISCKITGKPSLKFYKTPADAAADMAKTSRIIRFIGKITGNSWVQGAIKATTYITLTALKGSLYVGETITENAPKAWNAVADSKAATPIRDFFRGFFGTGNKSAEELNKTIIDSLNEGLNTDDPARATQLRETMSAALAEQAGASVAEQLGVKTAELVDAAVAKAQPAVEKAKGLSSKVGETTFNALKKTKFMDRVRTYFFGHIAIETLQEVGLDPEDIVDSQDMEFAKDIKNSQETKKIPQRKNIIKLINSAKDFEDLKNNLDKLNEEVEQGTTIVEKNANTVAEIQKALINQLEIFKEHGDTFDEDDIESLKVGLDQKTIHDIVYKEATEKSQTDDTFTGLNDEENHTPTTTVPGEKSELQQLEDALTQADQESDPRKKAAEVKTIWSRFASLFGKGKEVPVTERDFNRLLDVCTTSKEFYTLQNLLEHSKLQIEAKTRIIQKSAETLTTIMKNPAEAKNMASLKTNLVTTLGDRAAKPLVDALDQAKESKPADTVVTKPRSNQPPRRILAPLFGGSTDNKPGDKPTHSPFEGVL